VEELSLDIKWQKKSNLFKNLKYLLLRTIFLPLGYFIIRLWWATLRIDYVNGNYLEELTSCENGFIVSFWHGDMFTVAAAGTMENKKMKFHILTSKSRDGEILSRFLHRLGFGTVRGSSSRGGMSALLSLKDLLEQGKNTALAVDGPRGPRLIVKPGVILLARTTGAAILPAAINAPHKITLRSWDRCEIPLPFTHCGCILGKPIKVACDLKDDAMELVRKELEETLLKLKMERNDGERCIRGR
jgi:hypothetical protein